MNVALVITLVCSVIVAIFASVTAPLILAHRTERMHREDRIADWQRQDALAEAAKQATAKVAEATEETNGKLDAIHGLVNSNLTAAMQSELDALETSRALMQEVIDLKKANGGEPTAEAQIAIQTIQDKIQSLTTAIADREQSPRPPKDEA